MNHLTYRLYDTPDNLSLNQFVNVYGTGTRLWEIHTVLWVERRLLSTNRKRVSSSPFLHHEIELQEKHLVSIRVLKEKKELFNILAGLNPLGSKIEQLNELNKPQQTEEGTTWELNKNKKLIKDTITYVQDTEIDFKRDVDEESFLPLRDLLDYCQLALVLPCYAAQMWIKTDMGPPEISAVHAGLGIIATIIYVTTELRRQDLCDLAVFANAVSLFVVGALTMNLFTIIATSVLVAGYYVYKRPDDQCCMAPQDKFNFVMAVFAILSLASFDDNVTRNVQDTLQSIVGAAAN
ncbi:hypothetical protein HUJ04_002978 [Dendroctonus ponderosae]|nr:hypothetical protein HUJ04_002978 [Dendroctonus ponderosae]